MILLGCLTQDPIIKSLSAFVPQLARGSKFEKILHDAACGISFPRVTAASLKMILLLFLTAIALYLSLKILKSSSVRFETTFRMLCYLGGACAAISIILILLILIVGNLGSISAGMKISFYATEALVRSCIGGMLYFVGLKKVHHLSSWRTILVLLLAMLLPLLAVILLVAFLIAIILAVRYFIH